MAYDLARKLIEDLDPAADPAATPSLSRAIARYERSTSAQRCRGAVQSMVDDYSGKPTQLHLDLAALPFKLVLCATYDSLMLDAFRQVGKLGATAAFYNHAQTTGAALALEAPTVAKPLVYSLLGRSDHPESMVLNEQDLLDYLVSVAKDTPALPDALRSTLLAPPVRLLFIGFGFENWWLRLLLKVLQVIGANRRMESVALEGNRAKDESAFKDSKDFFDTQGIFIQSDDWNLLARELRERVVVAPPAPAAVPATAGALTTAPRSMQMVFLSYASQDQELVDDIRQGLVARGFDVWQDKNNLRAGQAWRPEIEGVIRRVRFFVFVQTAQMDRRDLVAEDGVYHRELALALDRSKDLPYGTTFVIHATVGPCRPRPEPELQALHRIALDDEAGLDRLVNDMRAALSQGAAT